VRTLPFPTLMKSHALLVLGLFLPGIAGSPRAAQVLPVPGPEVAALVTDLASPLTPVRIAAAEGLGKVGPKAETAVPALIRALNDPEVVVRTHSAWALGKVGKPAGPIVPALITKLRAENEEWAVRHNAALSLSWLGEPAVAELKATLSHRDPWARAYAGDSLFRLAPTGAYAGDVVPVARRLLAEREPRLRSFSATLLSHFGPAAAVALPELVALLADKDVEVRKVVVQVFPRLGPTSKSATPALLNALKEDNEQWVRIGAAASLGEIGDASPEVIRGLIGAFNDKRERVAAYAVTALANLGEPTVPELQSALKSPDKTVRMLAADAFAFMGTRAGRKAGEASASLVPVLRTDREWEVRFRAATALGVLAVPSDSVIGALKDGAKDEHEIVRLNSETALKKLTRPSRAE
jgi:HEAT repeat protein